LRAAHVRVAAVDVSPQKLDLAGQLGANLTLDPRSHEAKDVIRSFSRNGGVHCVFNCVGTGASMRQSADFVMRCGRIVVIGEEPQFPEIDTIEIAQRELEIVGSRNGTRQDMQDAIRYIETGALKPYVAARFPLAEINAAFECMRNGALGRIVVVIKE
jgi:propanol-preferring alcohol dehydrogenase